MDLSCLDVMRRREILNWARATYKMTIGKSIKKPVRIQKKTKTNNILAAFQSANDHQQ
jgi:hypothetical protein